MGNSHLYYQFQKLKKLNLKISIYQANIVAYNNKKNEKNKIDKKYNKNGKIIFIQMLILIL